MPRWPRVSAAVLCLLAPMGHALALWDGRLELFGTQTLTRDDNVFRLSGGSDPATVLGATHKGDSYRTTTLGLNLDVPVGRQRLQGSLAWNSTRYDRFSVLNLDGYDGRAAWQWQLGNDWSGRAGHAQTRSLASLANVQGGVQSGTPNPLTQRRSYAEAAWRATPRWELRAEVARLGQENEAPDRRVNDIDLDSGELVLNYVTPAQNRLGLSLQAARGALPNRELVAGLLIDNSYRQSRAGLVLEWILGGHTRLNARAGRVSRRYAEMLKRDFADNTYELAWRWTPTGKLTLAAIAQNDISATEQVNVSLVMAQRVALHPAWRLSEKVELQAVLETSERSYHGEAGQVLGTVPPRSERVRAVGLAAAYRPLQAVTLNLSWRRETRAATAAFGDYEANIVSLGGRIGF